MQFMPNRIPRQKIIIRECKQVFKVTKDGEDYLKAMRLTKREREVVESMVSHAFNGNKDLARRLFISEKGVKFHLTNIYKKLKCGRGGVILNMTPYLMRVPVEIK
jgi:DNA-binding CsgD family transcriptional regulator